MSVDALLGKMTLNEKVGQVFLLAFDGGQLDEARVLFEQHFVGGSYLSNDNLPEPQVAAALTSQIQGFAANTRLAIPLLLGADQEGAWSVMYPASSTGPGNMALGATGQPEDTQAMYRVIGRELAATGVNTLLAPCADCNSNPHNAIIGVRSFGEHPERVGAMVEAAVRGAFEGGAIPVLKHFPGHGDTTSDSHRGLPTVTRNRDELFAIDLYPFARGIAAGAPVVMTAHILFPALDPERPATLSPLILGDVLRGEMGFEGVILTDSMNMQAMRRNYDPRQSAVDALAAGVDMIMLAEEHYNFDRSAYLKNQVALIEAVKAAVRSGQLAEARLDDAVRRILLLKERLPAEPALDPAAVGSAGHRAVEVAVSRDALAVIRAADALLPFAKDRPLTLVNTALRAAYEHLGETRGIGPNQTDAAFDLFTAAVQRRAPGAFILSAEDVLNGVCPAPGSAVIAVTENHPLPGTDFDQSAKHDVLRALDENVNGKFVIVALRDPYELEDLPFIRNYVCAFSSRACAAEAAAELVFGETRAPGMSPVSIPGAGTAAQ